MRACGSGDRGAPFGVGCGKGERRGCPRGLEKGGSPCEAEQTCCQGFRETMPSTEHVLAMPCFVQGELPFLRPTGVKGLVRPCVWGTVGRKTLDFHSQEKCFYCCLVLCPRVSVCYLSALKPLHPLIAVCVSCFVQFCVSWGQPRCFGSMPVCAWKDWRLFTTPVPISPTVPVISLSRRRNGSSRPSVRSSQRFKNKENLELSRAEAKEDSPPLRMTRSRAAASARGSKVVPETPTALQAAGKDPWVQSDHVGTAVPLQRSGAKPAELLPTSSGNGSPEEHGAPKSPLVPTAPELVVPCTPKASQAVPEPQPARAANVTVILSPGAGLKEGDGSPQDHSRAQEPSQPLRSSSGTPTGSRLSRRSVRRSLMGKPSLSRRTSLAEKYSLASKRESMIRASTARAAGKKRATQKRFVSSSSVDCEFGCRGGDSASWVFSVGVLAELPGLDRLQFLIEVLPGFLEPPVSIETQVTEFSLVNHLGDQPQCPHFNVALIIADLP